MKIGCNYLLGREALVRNKQIEIDYFSFPRSDFRWASCKKPAIQSFLQDIYTQVVF